MRLLTDNTLTAEDIEKARIELNETEEVKQEAIIQLRKALADKTTLRFRTDDVFFLKFLRPRKFNVQRALDNILKFYKFKAEHGEFFTTPSKEQDALACNISYFLPHRDAHGRAIHVVKISNVDSNFSIKDYISAWVLGFQHVVENEVTQVNGIVGIWDFSGLNSKIVAKYARPYYLWLIFTLLLSVCPARLKAGYVLNHSRIFEFVWNLTSPFIPEKIKRRLIFLGSDMSKLHQYLDPSILPQVFGGHLPNEVEFPKLLQEEYFLNENKYGYVR